MKYVIDIEDVAIERPDGRKVYAAKGFNSLVFDEVGLGKLEPYREGAGSGTDNCNPFYAKRMMWNPGFDGTYYLITSYGDICGETMDDLFKNNQEIGNAFRSWEEAEWYVGRLKLLAELRPYGTLEPKVDEGAVCLPGFWFKSREDFEAAKETIEGFGDRAMNYLYCGADVGPYSEVEK